MTVVWLSVVMRDCFAEMKQMFTEKRCDGVANVVKPRSRE